MQTLHEFMIKIGEIYFWAMILQLQPTLPLFKVLCSLPFKMPFSENPKLTSMHSAESGLSLPITKNTQQQQILQCLMLTHKRIILNDINWSTRTKETYTNTIGAKTNKQNTQSDLGYKHNHNSALK